MWHSRLPIAKHRVKHLPLMLRGVNLFDIYRGVGVPEGKKSMAFSLELRADDRTLTDTDSEAVVTKVLTALKEKLNAILR